MDETTKLLGANEWADWFNAQSAQVQTLTALVLQTLVSDRGYKFPIAANAVYQIVSNAKPIYLDGNDGPTTVN